MNKVYICDFCGKKTSNIHISSHYLKFHNIDFKKYTLDLSVKALGFNSYEDFINSDESNCKYCHKNKRFYDRSHNKITDCCSKNCSDKYRYLILKNKNSGISSKESRKKSDSTRNLNAIKNTLKRIKISEGLNSTDEIFDLKCPYCDKNRKIDHKHKRLLKTCGSEKCLKKLSNRSGLHGKSYAEINLIRFLTKNKIRVISQFKIKDFYHKYDLYLPDYNLIIEYDGTYWHEKSKNKDKKETSYAIENGFRILRLNSSKLKQNYKSLLIKNLNNEDLKFLLEK